jgi:nucleotide-binding universal stress UspA family protein
MFERILLAVDGSEHAMRAAKVAAELARAMKSERVRVVVCYDKIPSYLGDPNLQQAIHTRLAEAEKVLKDAVDALGSVPAEVHTEILEGDPAEVITDVARIRDSSVIVMGSRGLGGLAGLLLGSTSQKVVSHAPCPVLIVR